METSVLFDASYWEAAWHEANRQDRERAGEKKAIDVWNRRAASYDKNADSVSGTARIREALAFLGSYGVLQRKLKILDLGSGPGNFTLALAERGHHVTALDPAGKMLQAIEEKLEMRPDLKPLISTVHADWIPLSLDDYNWSGYFDLVFASMTPGVRDVATLEKAMKASGQYVYLSRFAGARTQSSVEAVWSIFHGSPYTSRSLDILFPLNWLYAKGYRPALHFARWEREHSQNVEEAVDEIMNILALRMDTDKRVEAAVRRYIISGADENGMFTEVKGATSAMLLWDVGGKVMTRLGE